MTLGLPPPSVLIGLPKFTDWYPGQDVAFTKLMDWYYGGHRYCGIAAPTGVGKTVLALLTAKLTKARTVILTASKGLQDQYMRDAAPLGGVTVRGQNNFSCLLVPGIGADEGPCHEGLSCEFRLRCPYRIQLEKALQAPIVVTNYAYWLAQTKFSTGLGRVDLLILDEGHLTFGALESHLTVYLSRFDLDPVGITFPTDPSELESWEAWKRWASANVSRAESVMQEHEAEIRDRRASGVTVPGGLSHAYRTAKSVVSRLNAMILAEGEWVIQRGPHAYRFTPRWVSPYGPVLFQQAPKILVMSAILTPKTADSIGIPGDDRTWIEVPSYFPPQNTPIYHVPTARINYRTDDYGTSQWVARIDQYIQRRLDRKGIIFTVSYDRANLLIQRSRYSDIMITHTTGDVSRIVQRFRQMPPPAVLVSPAVTTGWDFDEDTGVRYIIVGKIPWPDTKDPVMRARNADDKEWSGFLAMGTLVQEAGRATRSPSQRTEVVLVDDNVTWYMRAYSKYAPRWFLERYIGTREYVPDPLV